MIDRARIGLEPGIRRTLCDPGALLMMELDGQVDAGRAGSRRTSAKAGSEAAGATSRVDEMVSICSFKRSRRRQGETQPAWRWAG